jgi:hypothetical protein
LASQVSSTDMMLPGLFRSTIKHRRRIYGSRITDS